MKLLKFLFSATIGLLYGMLFAQKSGKKFRSELGKSEHPGELLLKELGKIASESGETATEWAKNSEELQKVLETGKDQFDALVEGVKGLGEGASEAAQEELEKLAENAKDAAKKLKKTAGKKATRFKNKLQKEVKTIAKRLRK